MNDLEDANKLRERSLQNRILNGLVHDILKGIKEDIQMAHKAGAHEVVAKLPILYDIPCVSNKNAQRIVWSGVIEALARKNYHMKLFPGDSECVLHVTWLKEEDLEMIEAQNKLIASCML